MERELQKLENMCRIYTFHSIHNFLLADEVCGSFVTLYYTYTPFLWSSFSYF